MADEGWGVVSPDFGWENVARRGCFRVSWFPRVSPQAQTTLGRVFFRKYPPLSVLPSTPLLCSVAHLGLSSRKQEVNRACGRLLRHALTCARKPGARDTNSRQRGKRRRQRRRELVSLARFQLD